MRHFLSDVARSFADLLWPPLCLHCRRSLEIGNPTFCSFCLPQLELIDPKERCPYCFTHEFNREMDKCCLDCLKAKRSTDKIAAVFDYEGPAATLIKQMKYGGQAYLAKGGGAYLAAQFLKVGWPLPDAVVPMPIALLRKWERGYNQSLLLAESFASILNVPVKDVLIRKSGHFSQAGLSFEQRLQLTSDAFDLRKGANAYGQNVLIIDDVMTTGTSIECCAEVLQSLFPKAIYGLTLCRAI